jgi:hypothetical protein
MELKEFISETLKQINDGLQEGSTHIKMKGGEGAADGYFNVSFDVALTTMNEENTGMGTKISVASIFKVGAEIEKNFNTSNFSRIQFKLPVHIKTK